MSSPEMSGAANEGDLAMVRAAVAAQLAAILPGVDLGPNDNFFSHGGDSFGLVRFVSGLKRHGLSLTARDFMDDPTPDGLIRNVLAGRRVDEGAS